MAIKPQSEGYKLLINGEPIAECKSIDIPISINKDSVNWNKLIKKSKTWSTTFNGFLKKDIIKTSMIYYMHRKNRYYFRNEKGKIMVEVLDPTGCMKPFKYGEMFDMEFTTE